MTVKKIENKNNYLNICLYYRNMIKSIEKDLQDIDNNYCNAIKDYNQEIERHKKTIDEYKLKIKKEKLIFIDTVHDKATMIGKCGQNVDDEFVNAFPEITCLGDETNVFNPKKVVEFRNNKAFQTLDDWNNDRGILPNRFVVSKGKTNNTNPIEIHVDNYLNIYYPNVGLYLLINKVPFPKTSFYLKRRGNNVDVEQYQFNDNYSEDTFYSIVRNDATNEEILAKSNTLIPKNVHIVYDYHNRFRKFSFFETKTEEDKPTKIVEEKSTEIVEEKIETASELVKAIVDADLDRFKDSDDMVQELVNEIIDEVTEQDIDDDDDELPVPNEFHKQPWGCDPDLKISKDIITEMVYDYIINNNLINSFNKKTIYTTGKFGSVIAELFHLTEKDNLTVINLHKYIDKLYDNAPKIVHPKVKPPEPIGFTPWNGDLEPRDNLTEPVPYTPQPKWSKLEDKPIKRKKTEEQVFETEDEDIYIVYHRGKCEADEPYKDTDNHIFGYYKTYEKAKEAMDQLVKNRNDNYIPFINIAIDQGRGVTEGLGKGCEEIETFKYGLSNQLTSIYKCKLNQ